MLLIIFLLFVGIVGSFGDTSRYLYALTPGETAETLGLKHPDGSPNKEKACDCQPGLNDALEEGGYDDIFKLALFLAHVGGASNNLELMEERTDGEKYEYIDKLCNENEGDGERYKKRGMIPILGKCEYEEAGKRFEYDLTLNPFQVATNYSVGFKTSVWKYDDLGMNEFAFGISHGDTQEEMKELFFEMFVTLYNSEIHDDEEIPTPTLSMMLERFRRFLNVFNVLIKKFNNLPFPLNLIFKALFDNDRRGGGGLICPLPWGCDVGEDVEEFDCDDQ